MSLGGPRPQLFSRYFKRGPLFRIYFRGDSPLLVAPKWVLSRHSSKGRGGQPRGRQEYWHPSQLAANFYYNMPYFFTTIKVNLPVKAELLRIIGLDIKNISPRFST